MSQEPAARTNDTRARREKLMEEHVAARRRRDAADLGSPEFRAAAEDVARIEIAIAELEEPPPPEAVD